MYKRELSFIINYLDNKEIKINECKPENCYNLSKLDISQITNLENLFRSSLINDICSMNEISSHDCNISKWDVSNVTNMSYMFYKAKYFNQNLNNWDISKVTNLSNMFSYANNFNKPLNNWNTSKVIDMKGMFAETKVFNQNIGNWNLDNIINCDFMFDKAKTFLDKYNSGKPLPNKTEDIKEWFNLNRERMNDIDLKDKYGEEIDMFFNKFTDINSINKI